MAAALTLASQPYRWPWHGAFDPSRTALLVIHDGSNARPSGHTAALLASLTALAAEAGLAIIELPAHADSSILLARGADFTVRRPHLGGFTGTDLDSILRRHRIHDLILAGFPFELGADCTMRQANDLGYECLALSDCCTGLAADTLAGALSSIQMSGGIFGAVAHSAAVLELFAAAAEAHRTPIGATS